MNYLVETKAEYTSQLINIIYPFIYDGMQSLYDEALKVSKDNEELRIFQSFLKKIPSWNPLILDSETSRILKESDCSDLLPQLLNAVIKSNIMVLTNTPPEKKHTIKLPKDIDFKKFIHHAYIETAKMIYNNPYLFYHKYSLYDIKKNQRDAQENIKNSINEAIRKLLPLQYILNEYLGEETPAMIKEQDFDKGLSDANKNILQKMITKQDLSLDNTNKQILAPPSSINQEIDKIREMLKNDPLDTALLSESEICDTNINNIKESIHKKDSITKKELFEDTNNNIPNDSESVAYYKNNNSKVIDSFSNKSNIRSLFYSNDPDGNKNINNIEKINTYKNQKSVNTIDVENYLKEQGQPSIKLSDDPNINSIKNVKTDKFKNKYYQV